MSDSTLASQPNDAMKRKKCKGWFIEVKEYGVIVYSSGYKKPLTNKKGEDFGKIIEIKSGKEYDKVLVRYFVH